jgi:hypothetical protein
LSQISSLRSRALDDDLAIERAQFDLPNMAASGIDLFGDESRAFRATASFAQRNAAASVNANFWRRGMSLNSCGEILRQCSYGKLSVQPAK